MPKRVSGPGDQPCRIDDLNRRSQLRSPPTGRRRPPPCRVPAGARGAYRRTGWPAWPRRLAAGSPARAQRGWSSWTSPLSPVPFNPLPVRFTVTQSPSCSRTCMIRGSEAVRTKRSGVPTAHLWCRVRSRPRGCLPSFVSRTNPDCRSAASA